MDDEHFFNDGDVYLEFLDGKILYTDGNSCHTATGCTLADWYDLITFHALKQQ